MQDEGEEESVDDEEEKKIVKMEMLERIQSEKKYGKVSDLASPRKASASNLNVSGLSASPTALKRRATSMANLEVAKERISKSTEMSLTASPVIRGVGESHGGNHHWWK